MKDGKCGCDKGGNVKSKSKCTCDSKPRSRLMSTGLKKKEPIGYLTKEEKAPIRKTDYIPQSIKDVKTK